MPVIQNFAEFIAAGGVVCPPERSKIEWGVGEESRLFVECRRSVKSVPTWYVRLDGPKGNIYERLGPFKDLSLTQARKLAQQHKAEHLLAKNVEAAPKADPKEMTLDTFMRDHYFPHAFLHKRSAKKDEQLFRIHIGPRFADTPLSQITRRDVVVFHNDLLKKGQSPASADHSLKLLRRALNLAVQWEYLEKNPLLGIELFNVDNGVENYLDDAAIQRLVAVLRTDKNRTVSLILMFLVSVGQRKTSALLARFSDIDLVNRVWKIPAANSKSKHASSVPLNDSAMWVLDQLDTKGKSEYLFVNKHTGKPFTSISKVWYRIRKEAGLNDHVRIHDLRHTFASMLVSAGRSLYQVQMILGHSDPKITMRYAHLSAKTLQEAANAASVLVPRVQPSAANMESVEAPKAA